MIAFPQPKKQLVPLLGDVKPKHGISRSSRSTSRLDATAPRSNSRTILWSTKQSKSQQPAPNCGTGEEAG
jgi:hypothetical protein